MTVDLSDQEWGQVMQIIATAPWNVANPLLMKIGEQLRKTQRVPKLEEENRGHVSAPEHDGRQYRD